VLSTKLIRCVTGVFSPPCFRSTLHVRNEGHAIHSSNATPLSLACSHQAHTHALTENNNTVNNTSLGNRRTTRPAKKKKDRERKENRGSKTLLQALHVQLAPPRNHTISKKGCCSSSLADGRFLRSTTKIASSMSSSSALGATFA
jgi:hypothetical protein